MKLFKKTALALALSASSFAISAETGAGQLGYERADFEEITVPVSKTEFNRIVFPEPFTELTMTGDVPVSDEIIPVSGNRAIIFEIEDDAEDDFQVIVHFESGKFIISI